MSETITGLVAIALVCWLTFAVTGTWKQANETNRFIEQLLHAVEQRQTDRGQGE